MKDGCFFTALIFLLLHFDNALAGTAAAKNDAPIGNDIRFTENKGQLQNFKVDWLACGNIKYYTQSFGGTAYFADKGIGFGFVEIDSTPKRNSDADDDEMKPLNTTGFFLEFIGKSDSSILTGLAEQITKYNFYHGANHISNVANYDAVLYRNLYDNIDLKYYVGDDKLKFDYILKVGAKIEQIQLRYQGMKGVSVNAKGDLQINTEWGLLHDAKPYSYQIVNGVEVPIDVSYKILKNGDVTFLVHGDYNHELDLVIDPPTLSWATMMGGADGNGYHYDITVDENGNTYGTGWYNQAFPMVNPIDVVFAGNEAFVYKLTSDGKTLLYATFLGGDGGGDDEVGTGIEVNAIGEAFVCGYTTSAVNFPKAGSPAQAFIGGATDIFAAKFSSTGALVYSTFYGSAGIDRAFAIDIDAANNAFITGSTASSSGFATAGAFQSSYGGGVQDAFLLKLNASGSTVLFCTYFGGAGNDLSRDVVVDLAGNPYIGGCTESSSGIASAGSFDNTYGGDAVDGFVAKFSADGTSRIYGAYVGGDQTDKVEAIDVRCNGELVATGYSKSTTTFTAINYIQPKALGGMHNRNVFLRRISIDGSSLLNSTFVGATQENALKNGVPFEYTTQKRGSGISINRLGNIAVVFASIDPDLPLVSPFQSVPGGGGIGMGDSYIFVTDTTATRIIFSTFFGGDENDYPTGGIKYHPNNDNIFMMAGNSHSTASTFPTTAGSFMPDRGTLTTNDQLFVTKWEYVPCLIYVDLAKPNAICKNDTLLFVVDTLCGGIQPRFQWLINGVLQIGAGTKSFRSNKLNDNDEVCVVFSKIIPGCFPRVEADTACVVVKVNPLPVLKLHDDSLCLGKSVVVNSNAGAGVFSWSTGDSAASIVVSNPGDYWLEIKQNGCSSRDTMHVKKINPFQLQLSSHEPSCFGKCDASLKVSVNKGKAPFSFAWTPSFAVGQGSDSLSHLCAGSYSVLVGDANACFDSISSAINQPAPLLYSLDSTGARCGQSDGSAAIKIISGGIPPLTYQWDVAAESQSTAIASYLQAGIYSIVVRDKNNCTVSDSVQVQSTQRPVLDSLVTMPLCAADCKGSALLKNVSGGTRPFVYSWTGPASAHPIIVDSLASNLCAGSYKMVLSDKFNCKDSVSFTIVDPAPFQLDITAPNYRSCVSGATALNAVASGGTANYKYTWHADPSLSATNVANPIATPLVATKYFVSAVDQNNCPSSLDSVLLLPTPAANFIFDTVPNCNVIATSFNSTSKSATAGHSCAWDFGNGKTTTECDPKMDFAAGVYTLKLTVVDDSLCADSSMQKIVLQHLETPVSSFEATPKVANMYDPWITFNNRSTDAISFAWQFGNGDSSQLENPKYAYSDTGTYQVCLTVGNVGGCLDKSCSEIRIEPVVSFYAPNAFTPNNDGVNDDFKPFASGYDLDDYELMIFDRWGELLFTSTNWNVGWNGIYKGRLAQIDVYVWKVRAREQYSRHLMHKIGRVSLVN